MEPMELLHSSSQTQTQIMDDIETEAIPEGESIPRMKVMGQILNTYILAQSGSDLLIIDQHAAHERINLDRLKDSKRAKKAQQKLITPIPLDLGKKERHTRLAIELEPQQADAMNFLGYSLAEQDRELEHALSLVSKALEIKPDNGYITDSLGWVYFKMGKLDMAIETLLKALVIVDSDPVIYEHLGDAYKASGKMQDALNAWQLSLQVLKASEMGEPYSSEHRQRVQDKIRSHDSGAAPSK